MSTALPLRLPFAFAKRYGLLLRQKSDGSAECLYRPPVSPTAMAEVRRQLHVPFKLVPVAPAEFDEHLQRLYEGGDESARAVEGLEGDTDLAHLAQDLPEQADLLESEDDAPIIRLINAVLTQAVKENASDIHIEPFENRLVVRFRVDGVLREVLQSKRAVAPLVVSRIKVMSKLDIAEKRLPQDGRIGLKIAGRASADATKHWFEQARGLTFSPGGISDILRITQGIPYLLQRLDGNLVTATGHQRTSVPTDLLRRELERLPDELRKQAHDLREGPPSVCLSQRELELLFVLTLVEAKDGSCKLPCPYPIWTPIELTVYEKFVRGLVLGEPEVEDA